MFRNGRDDHAFSNIDGFCIDSLSSQHEFGHNFGCFHNRDDAGSDDEYAHGYRYCEGEDRWVGGRFDATFQHEGWRMKGGV